MLKPSSFFTIGPYHPDDLAEKSASDLVGCGGATAVGEQIIIKGRLWSAPGVPVENAIIEVWQPDAQGIFNHPDDPMSAAADKNFLGWGRNSTDRDGYFQFRTIKPGTRLNGNGIERLPHINLSIFASGIMSKLSTVLFFEEDRERAQDDIVAAAIPSDRLDLLFSTKQPSSPNRESLSVYCFEVMIKGPRETPFFME